MFAEINEKQAKRRQHCAYAIATLSILVAVLLVLFVISNFRVWFALAEFVVAQTAFVTVFCFLHRQLSRLNQVNFKKEIRSIHAQNWAFFFGSILRVVFLVLIDQETESDDAYLLSALLFVSCLKLAIPVLYYMVVHHRTFRKVDKLTKAKILSEKDDKITIHLNEEPRETDVFEGSRMSLNESTHFREQHDNRHFTKKTSELFR